MGRTYGTPGWYDGGYKIVSGRDETHFQLIEVAVRGKIILKWILTKQFMNMQIVFICFSVLISGGIL